VVVVLTSKYFPMYVIKGKRGKIEKEEIGLLANFADFKLDIRRVKRDK
jgi:hypothetical protein